MKMRRNAYFALTCLLFTAACYSQYPSYSDTSGNSQGYPQSSDSYQTSDCADPIMAATNSSCSQGDRTDDSTPNTTNPITGMPLTGLPQGAASQWNPRLPNGGALENAPLRQDNVLRATQQQLPPEAPTEFQKFVAATAGQFLPVYGSNLFRNVPSTFAPNDLAPVTPDYVVGPDDELRLRIWGQISYSGNLRVNRSGDIYVAQVGAIHVAGLTFAELDQHVRQAVSRVYRNFDLSVDMGRIRSIQVYVTGRARRPGAYTVSSLSSLVNALFASGGPSLDGSLRHVLLKRNGQTITDLDLYALLSQGDKTKDVRLLPEDVIYIAPVGSQVAITGSIREPAIYELREGETLSDAFKNAGETSAMASNSKISLDRVYQHQYRQTMEIDFNSESLKMPLVDGDIIRVFPIVPAYMNTVTLRGNVANPGRFSWHSGMHLSELIPDRDSLVGRDYWWKRSHLGLSVPEFEPMISTIGQDLRTPEMTSRGFTTSVSQDTLSWAITNRAQEEATDRNSDSRTSTDSRNTTDPAYRDPRAAASGSSLGADVGGTQTQRRLGDSIPNNVFLAAPEINWNYAVIERIDPDTLRTSLIPFDLGKLVLKHDANEDKTLQPGDTITIFSQTDINVPQAERTKYVRLDGEFVHAGVYSVKPGETLRDLVRRAGGFTSKAYLYGSEFTRESTRRLQQQRMDEYIRSVGLEAQRGMQALAASGSITGTSATNVAASRDVTDQLVNRLRQVRATGRIVLQLRPDSRTIDEIPDLSLENGDRFAVPSVPDTVNVVGAVFDQNSFLYMSKRTAGRYLRLAGGPTRNADTKYAFIIRADGSVISKKTVNSALNNWSGNGFNDLRVNPGDTIVMPDKTLRPSAIRNLLDWTQSFSQLAFGAAAINAIR
jgi:protein involved in polysaccharide export with SLBB domain